ncbi:unnamed protein product, partial [Mesorhabditis spiculigera]
MTEPQFLPLKPADEPETSGVVSLECGVCYEGGDPGIMVVTTCGHIFCANCMCKLVEVAAQKRGRSVKCATCNKPLKEKEIIPIRGQSDIENPWKNRNSWPQQIVPPSNYAYFQVPRDFFWNMMGSSIVFGFLAFAHCLIIGHTAYAGEVDKAERAALLGLWVMDAVQLIFGSPLPFGGEITGLAIGEQMLAPQRYLQMQEGRMLLIAFLIRLDPGNLECGVCYEDCDPGIMVVTTCGHLFCASCMRGLVEFAAKKMAGLLKCAGCLRPLNLNEIIPLQGQKGVKNPWLNAKNLKIPQPKFVYYQASKEFFHPLVIQAFFCLLLAIAHFAIGACTVWKKESSIAAQIGMMFLWTMDFAQMVAMGYYTAYFLYQSAMMNHPNR